LALIHAISFLRLLGVVLEGFRVTKKSKSLDQILNLNLKQHQQKGTTDNFGKKRQEK